jgi:cytidylate kinase
MKAVICLSGSIASGKTTVAQALAEHFSNVTVRSFGDVVRDRARSQGKPLDRATLQAVGLTLVEAGWQPFVDALLHDVPESSGVLIVDGIRHCGAVDELKRRQLGDRFLTVYLKLDSHELERRLQKRCESPVNHEHLVESSLPDLEARADLVLNGALPLPEIEATILDHLYGYSV